MNDYCEFQIDHGFYVVPMILVREVLQVPLLSPVPLAPTILLGMTCHRGEVLPVFEIKSLLTSDHTENPPPARTRTLVLAHDETVLGLQVDQISRVSAPDNIEPEVPQETPPLWSLFQTKEGSRNLRLIHLDRLVFVLNSLLQEHA